MAYELASVFNEGLLEITIKGQGSKDEVKELVLEVIDLAQRSNPENLLIDLRLAQGRLSILETFNIVYNYPRDTPQIRTVVVDSEENKSRLKFYETVSVNMGHPFRYFADIDKARAWLKS